MPTEFSGRAEAHKIEALAKDLTAPYDANKGCTTAEKQLIAELQMLQKDPAKEKIVQRWLLLDDLIPNDLPVVRISHEPKDQLKLHIVNTATGSSSFASVDTTGHISGSTDPAIAASDRQWILDNFDLLDTNKDGKVSDLEIEGKNPPSADVYSIPRLAGSRIGTVKSESMGYGYRMSNIGSIGSLSYGFGSSTDDKDVYGITKDQLKHLVHQNDDQHCDK